MGNTELDLPFEAGQIVGETVVLPPDFVSQRVEQSAEPPLDYLEHARMVADIESTTGEVYRSALGRLSLEDGVEPGTYNVRLGSRKNKIIVATGAALLVAAGVGAAVQFNRTHRKKKRR